MTVASGRNGASPYEAVTAAVEPPPLPQRRSSRGPSVHAARFVPDFRQIAAARSWCRSVTKMSVDASYGLLLVISEFYTNALIHSASGLPGGGVEIEVRCLPNAVRVQITDDGPHPDQPPSIPLPRADITPIEEHGRGLTLVDDMSRRWGWEGTLGHPITVWALLDRYPER